MIVCLVLLYVSYSPMLVLGQPVFPVSPSGTLFIVTAVTANSNNPNFGSNLAPSGGIVYAINGTGASGPATLTLIRGGTYTFDSSAVHSIHPFYISTDPVGAGVGAVPNGGPLSSPGQLTYIADPNGKGNTTLYFDCHTHPHMGGNIIVTGPNFSVHKYEAAISTMSILAALCLLALILISA